MKKFLISLLLLVAMVTNIFAMTACTGSDDDDSASLDDMKDTVTAYGWQVPAGGYDGSEVVISFYHTMGEGLRAELDKAIAKFNELYPKITIDHKQVGGYNDVLNTIRNDLNTGSQPNIAYCYPDHVALYNKASAAVALDNLINSKIEVVDFHGFLTCIFRMFCLDTGGEFRNIRNRKICIQRDYSDRKHLVPVNIKTCCFCVNCCKYFHNVPPADVIVQVV